MNDGVYLIAYNSLKGGDDEEIELRSIQTKNHTVDMHDDDMNKVILNTSTTAYPSSSTTTTITAHAVEKGRITLNGIIAIAPYVKKNTSTTAATAVVGGDFTSMKLQSSHQKHEKDQQLCLVTCLCQSDCDSASYGNSSSSSSCSSSGSSSSSSSRDGIWVKVAEEDACMDSFIIDHLTSLRDKIQCEKYEMMMMTTNNSLDGVNDSCNNSEDNSGNGGQRYNCPPIVMWSIRNIPANSHQTRRSAVVVMIIYTVSYLLSIYQN